MKSAFLKNIPPSILVKLKDINLETPTENCHQAINDLLQRSVLLGGKRLRPLLTYIFCDLYGIDFSNHDLADICATSIEMVHAASLAHDDVIDEATQRRGNPSINIQASNKKAVLAGDYLLAAVITRLTEKGSLELVGEMSKVISALSLGEWLQADAIIHRQYNRDLIAQIASCKTSSVMSWCAVAPGLIAGADRELIEKGRLLGEHLGQAFQLLDDTLDFGGESQKDTLLDLKNGQVNSVVFEWLELHPEIHEAFKKGEDIMDLFNEDQLDKAIQIIKDQAFDHLNQCRELLTEMKSALGEKVVPKNLDRAEKTLLFILNYLAERKS